MYVFWGDEWTVEPFEEEIDFSAVVVNLTNTVSRNKAYIYYFFIRTLESSLVIATTAITVASQTKGKGLHLR